VKVDYLIVGQGIAGSVMALTLEKMGKSVAILSKPQYSSSSFVAAGVYNPFNFRKSVPVWRAGEACKVASEFYRSAELKLGASFHAFRMILRVIESTEEREQWKQLMLDPDRMFAKAFAESIPGGTIKTPHGAGTIVGGGILSAGVLIREVGQYFDKRGYYLYRFCDHSGFITNESSVSYNNEIEASHVIFCEGHLAKNNPFFDSRVVAPTKGEVLHLKIPGLSPEAIINGPVYLASIGDDKFVAGATFNPGKSDEEITDAGKEELIRKLKTMTSLPFEVIGHFAGVRPAGRDRKPVLGRSRTNRNFSIFNGFGSKAVLHAPFLAQMLADHLENGTELLPEVNVARFKVY
jgi:glycine oxidase